MQRRAWIVASVLVVVGSSAWAQAAPPVEGPTVAVERPVLKQPRVIDGAVELRIHKVVDGRVLAGQEFPAATLDALIGRGFVRVAQASAIRPEVIHDGRLYRSYRVTESGTLHARDFARYVGQTVKVRISEIVPGQSYALTAIVN